MFFAPLSLILTNKFLPVNRALAGKSAERSMQKYRVVELIEELETEINNGGFDQFFFNSSGENTKETIKALKLVGAKHTAQIVMNASNRFPNSSVPIDREQRQEQLEVISPEADAFEREDEIFLEYVDDLAGLIGEYKSS